MGHLDGSEHVLVVPQATLDGLGRFHGFRPLSRLEGGEALDALLEPALFLPRCEGLEHDERGLAFKQLVAYGVLCRRGRVFAFRRPAKGGDRRLAGRCSVGLGGHVNPVDVSAVLPELGFLDPTWPMGGTGCLAACMARELREEVDVAGLSLHLAGLLNDDSNDVGRRHLGVVFRCEVGGERVTPSRAEVEPLGWFPGAELAGSAAPTGQPEWERWSAIAIAHIEEILNPAAAAAT
jgi:predicted NUDIX family phosphoesterase